MASASGCWRSRFANSSATASSRRTVYPVVPPRVDYELTALGASLLETIQALVTWTETHQTEVAAARSAYDAREVGEPSMA